MKRFYLTLMLSIIAYVSYGQVKFGSWNSWGASFSFEELKGDSALMTMTYRDETNHLPMKPKLLLKTRDDEVYELTGKLLRSKMRENGSYIVGHAVISEDYAEEDAQFLVSKEMMEHVKTGVVKLRLNCLPRMREKNFLKKSFGKKLYKAYRQSLFGAFYTDF